MTSSKKSASPGARSIGTEAFAAITAVEGLRLGAASKGRLASLRSQELSPGERREAVLRAYVKAGKLK